MVEKVNGIPNLFNELTVGKARFDSLRKKSFGERNKELGDLANKRDKIKLEETRKTMKMRRMMK
ncbi:hypothetical protein LCGC14_0993940 [marine sediment metagenome]|uniref:Uncharacterized protein n=1 Tax=marine sediment metagenome TaxID=412755 RepID=A0A0F9RBE2_9ZZZZ